MTDYTPTTEDVKYSYAQQKQDEAGFDRWFAEVKAQARKAEREYLIQYLQSEIKSANEWSEKNKNCCTPEDNVKNSMVIAAYENLAETLIANPYRTKHERTP